MAISISTILTNTYLIATLSMFLYLLYPLLSTSTLSPSPSLSHPNYFSTILLLLDKPTTKLFLYNVIICISIIVYKLTIRVFYVEVKENQMVSLLEKIGYKLFELCYFLYIVGGGFGIGTFAAVSAIFLMYVFHNIAIARANFLIHTHVTENMGMNYRLLAHFLLMLFVDYQLVMNTAYWLFSDANDSSKILFAYYCITISMSIVQPALNFFMHFYQIYTQSQIQNMDINMVKLKFIINVPRLIIQLFLCGLIGYQFSLTFLMIFTLIQSITQISKTFKNYSSMKSLIDKMKNLRELSPEQLEKEHDKICTVCFHDIMNNALFLPCKHIFHRECLRQWIVKNSNHHCPKCKKSFNFQNMKASDRQNELKRLQQNLKQHIIQGQRLDPLQFSRDGNRFPNIRNKISQNQVLNQMGQQRSLNSSSNNEQNIPILQLSQNSHLALQQGGKKPQKAPKPRNYNIGSVPFGLPTQAIYRRKVEDIEQRDRIIHINNKMIKLMKMDPAKQLLFVPQF